MKLILVEDDGRQVDLIADEEAPFTVEPDTSVRSILKAVRYILGAPEGGSILDTAVLVARRAKDHMKCLARRHPMDDGVYYVQVPVHRDLIQQLREWSAPVQVRIQPDSTGFSMEMRKPEDQP